MQSEKDLQQAQFFRNRLAKNERNLRRWARREGVEALRLYDKDIPEIPLALDRYGDELLMALYERPYEKDEELEEAWLRLMAESAAEALGLEAGAVHHKRRRRQRGDQQYQKLETRGQEKLIHEAGLAFLVNLDDYLDTGLFLDHRITRQMVRSEALGKRVLNLFSYTGSFSVYAAAGGASEVTSVDLSKTYLDWAGRNLEANGFSHRDHPLVHADVLAFLAEAKARKSQWDLIVADPPTFSNSKRTEEDFDVNEAWPSLLEACIAVLSPRGSLYFSSNSRKLRWDAERAAGLQGMKGRSWQDISEKTIPPDFRDHRIHRCWHLVPRQDA